MKKLLIICVSTILMFCMISGCSNPGGSKTDSQADEQQVTVVLDWVINTNHTGLYVAKEKGYFEEFGLKVDIQAPPETGAASLVVSGAAEFGISYQEEVTFARAEDTPIVSIAAIVQNNTSAFASRAEADIVSPKDFEGKRYGGWGSPMEEAMLKALMDNYNADYNLLEIFSVGDMDFFAATESNVDFTWIYMGWDGVAADLMGIDINYILLRDEEPALNYYTPVIISSEDYLNNNGETVKRFLNAVSKGYEYAIENPEEAADILIKYAPEMDRDLVVASQEYLADEYKSDAPRWGEMKESVWEDFARWMIEKGLLTGEVEIAKAFTNEFLPQ